MKQFVIDQQNVILHQSGWPKSSYAQPALMNKSKVTLQQRFEKWHFTLWCVSHLAVF